MVVQVGNKREPELISRDVERDARDVIGLDVGLQDRNVLDAEGARPRSHELQ